MLLTGTSQGGCCVFVSISVLDNDHHITSCLDSDSCKSLGNTKNTVSPCEFDLTSNARQGSFLFSLPVYLSPKPKVPKVQHSASHCCLKLLPPRHLPFKHISPAFPTLLATVCTVVHSISEPPGRDPGDSTKPGAPC